MTPPGRHIDPTDPTSMALALTALHGDVAVLQREVSSNIQNLTSATQAIQAEQRHQSEQMGEIVRLQQQYLANSEGLNRAFTEIAQQRAELRTAQEAITDGRGRVRGVWVAGSIVVGLVAAIYTLAWTRIDERFARNDAALADAKAERVAVEARRQSAHDADVQRMQQQITEMRAQLETVKSTRGAR